MPRQIPKVAVEVAFDGGPFSESYKWTDISEYVRGFRVRRGRNNELDRIEAGTLSLSLDNADGRFTPGKQKAGVNALAGQAGKVTWNLHGLAEGQIIDSLSVAQVEDDGAPRIMSRTVYTNGRPVACRFAVRWLDAGGATVKFDQGTRFIADEDPAVYTHTETPPPGAASAVLHIYADAYPEGSSGLVAYGEKAEWYKIQPYYPNVLPRRRVRVRSANLMPKNTSTGGDTSRTARHPSFGAYGTGSSRVWAPIPKSGAGSVRVDFEIADTAPFAAYVRCGMPKTSMQKRHGLTRMEAGRTYTASGQVRLGGTSRDVNLAARFAFFDQADTLMPRSNPGPTVSLTSPRGNLVLNPSAEVNLDHTQLYGSSSRITRARVTADSHTGTACIEHTHIADAGSAGSTWSIEPVPGGQTVSFGVWVKIPATGLTGGQIAWRNGTDTLRIIPLSPLPEPGKWVRLSGSYKVPTGQTVNRVGVSFVGDTGAKWYADACHAAASETVPEYVDGSMPGWRWAGDPHASASARVVDDAAPGDWVTVPPVTATAPPGAVWGALEVGCVDGGNGAFFFLDEMQIEEGEALSDWLPGGSIFHGHIERWPVTADGLTASVEVTAVDGFSVLANTDLRAAVQDQILSLKPAGYWPLGEPVGATRLENLANDQEPAKLVPSKYGGATARLGAPSIVRNDPTTSFSLTNVATNQGTIVDICDNGARRYPLDDRFSMSFWCQPVYPSSGQTSTLFRAWADNASDFLKIQINSTGKLIATGWFANGASVTTGESLYPLSSSKPSFVFISSEFGTLSVYVNGTLHGIERVTGTTDYALRDIRWASLGGAQAGSYYQEYANGRYGHLALWGTNIRDEAATQIWQVGDNGGVDFVEAEKARLDRLIAMAKYEGELSIDDALSSLQGIPWESGAKALEELQGAAEDASGYVFMDGDGVLTYHNRARRQSAPVRFELSDSLGLPYEPGLTFEMDEDRIINEVTYKRPGGAEGVLKDPASIVEYGRKSKPLELRLSSDSAIQDAAYTLLNQYSTPIVRCDSVTLKASAAPDLFLVALGVEIGDRIRLSELPAQAPEESLDYYVEAIETDVSVEGGTIEWVTTLALSPASNSDVWVLEDGALGRLDRSAVLAY
ncbi:LamG-like jellyroll fold domain-containing protein [Streptomyces cinereoruber]|uniref:LamG-like jellyroll fold domain-containing protein n=1 Tax=Streptomyces cinereoruber TaxID=67260 RepID=UPI00363ED537